VYDASQKAIEHVRTKSEPFLLEIMTYRFRGHSMGDPERYRKADEVHRWEEEDPIGLYRKYLLSNTIASEVELNAVDDQSVREVQDAVDFAEASPEPAPEDLFKNIYADDLEG
jgi:pyruvate dehydrogenase E1 component alpha subunit